MNAVPDTNHQGMSSFYKLRKILDKEIRYESHRQFLEDCVHHQIIPNGFSLNWKLGLESDENDKVSVINVLKMASFQLLHVVNPNM